MNWIPLLLPLLMVQKTKNIAKNSGKIITISGVEEKTNS